MNTKTLTTLICTAGAIGIVAACWLICEHQYRLCSQNVVHPQTTATTPETTQEPAPQIEEKILSNVDPAMIFQRLNQLRPNTRNTVREAFFCFQGFLDAGSNSFPAIRKYAESGHNVILAGNRWSDIEPRDPKKTPVSSFQSAGSILIIPASTRMGLVDVLKEINTLEAFNILAQILPTSQDAFEVVKISRILLTRDSSAFAERIRGTARVMLATTKTKKDRHELIKLLAEAGDIEPIQLLAQELMDNGKLDRSALDPYFNTLKADALPTLSALFKDTNTSERDRRLLLKTAFSYVGNDALANEMYLSSYTGADLSELPPVSDTNKNPINTKMMLLCELLAEGREEMGIAGTDEDGKAYFQSMVDDRGTITPEIAQSRLNFLNTLPEDDEQMISYIDAIREKFNAKIHPESFPEDYQFQLDKLPNINHSIGYFTEIYF